jgi:hypothetical protein
MGGETGGGQTSADNPKEADGGPEYLCGARTRSGAPCRRAKAFGRTRCRLHGGAHGSGAPSGERNGNYRDGSRTNAAIAERIWARRLVDALIDPKGGVL